ncbi:MAG TPA: hypothetical protein VF714_11835, partial [Jatrophihabitans sp.]
MAGPSAPEQPRSVPGKDPARPTANQPSRWQQRRAAKKRRLAKMSPRKRVLRRIGLVLTSLLGLLALLAAGLAIAVYSV